MNKIEYTIKLQPVNVPDFMLEEMKPCLRQDGFRKPNRIPVSELPVATLEEICAEFRRGLFEKAGGIPIDEKHESWKAMAHRDSK